MLVKATGHLHARVVLIDAVLSPSDWRSLHRRGPPGYLWPPAEDRGKPHAAATSYGEESTDSGRSNGNAMGTDGTERGWTGLDA